jgi:hypothetical protein
MLGQGVVPVLLLTVHGHVRLIGRGECRGWGVPWLTVLPDFSPLPIGNILLLPPLEVGPIFHLKYALDLTRHH